MGRKKKTSQPKKKTSESEGLIPMMLDLADLLPEPYRSHSREVIGIFGFGFIALIIIFVLSAVVAAFTGHPEWTMTIFAGETIAVGAACVYAVVNRVKKNVK